MLRGSAAGHLYTAIPQLLRTNSGVRVRNAVIWGQHAHKTYILSCFIPISSEIHAQLRKSLTVLIPRLYWGLSSYEQPY